MTYQVRYIMMAVIMLSVLTGCETIGSKIGFNKPSNPHETGCQRTPDLNHVPLDTENYPRWP